MIKNCTFIGWHAGEDITEGDGLVIIGDNIREIPEGARVVIGEMVFGVKCNLASIVKMENGEQVGITFLPNK